VGTKERGWVLRQTERHKGQKEETKALNQAVSRVMVELVVV
jgi:hypothetical protein